MSRQGVRTNRRIISQGQGEEETDNNTEIRTKAAEDRAARFFHFRCLEDKLIFEKIYHKRKTITGRIFEESFLREIKFPYLERLQRWGWMPFITLDRPSYHNLVRYFYYNGQLEMLDANYQPIPRTLEANGFHTYAHNRHFSVRYEDVWEALGEPRNKPNVGSYHAKSFNHLKGCRVVYNDPGIKEIFSDVTKLSFHDRILHLMVCQTINPRQGSWSTLTLEDIWLMTTIILNRPPNLHEYLMGKLKRTIKQNKRKGKRGLFYGKFVSKIIEMRLGSGISDSKLDPETKAPFGKGSVKQIGFRYNNQTGEWYRPADEPMEIDEDEDEEDTEDEDMESDEGETEGEDSDELEDAQGGEDLWGDDDSHLPDYSIDSEMRDAATAVATLREVNQEHSQTAAAAMPVEVTSGQQQPSPGEQRQAARKLVDEGQTSAPTRTNCPPSAHNTETDTTTNTQIKQHLDALGVHVAAGFRGINARLFEIENNQDTIAATLRAVQVKVGIPLQTDERPPAAPENSSAPA